MHLSPNATADAQPCIEIPFTFVNSHVVVSGRIHKHPVHFILDTGAPESMLDASAAKRVELRFDETAGADGRGLDGGSVVIYDGGSATVLLADRPIPKTAFRVGALPVFQPMAVHDQNIGLLGTAFFARFSRVELDFTDRVLRLSD
jgi:hypothetical protein